MQGVPINVSTALIPASGSLWVSLLLAVIFLVPHQTSNAQAPRFAGCDVLTQIPEEECDALEIFFNKMDGEFWRVRGGWLIAGQPCEWAGVVCETGPWPRHVKKIVLIDNNVGGSIPGELSFLKELEELVIENTATAGYFNVVGGFLPNGMSDLPKLKVLRIRGHEIRGPIPEDFVNLSSLEVLDLSDNQLDGPIPDVLGDLPNLRELDLSGNAFRGLIPPELGNLSTLEKIDLGNNELVGPIPGEIGTLPALRIIDFQANNLTGRVPESLANLDSLISLTLTDNNLDGPPPPGVIKLASRLSICTLAQRNTRFCVPDTPLYRFNDQSAVCDLPLDPSCSFCSGASGTSATECSGLESLYYATDGLNWLEQSSWLSTSLPCEWPGVGCDGGRVTSLLLPENNLSGPLPEAIGGLANLDVLDLSGNNLEGALPPSIAVFEENGASCNLGSNHETLCIPDDPVFAALGSPSVCGLPVAVKSCSSVLGAGTFNEVALSDADASLLTWRADVRIPDFQFEVEQKTGSDFVRIGIVNTPLAASSPDVYGFPLTDLSNGINTFRIRLTGGTAPSDVVSQEVEVIAFADSYFLEAPFPNPTRGDVTIRFAVEDGDNLTLSLYDISGRRVRTLFEGATAQGAVEAVRIQTEGLASGLYMVTLEGSTFSSSTSFVLRR